MVRPQRLAIRTANQYRTRDILAYLGLRYFLNNQCARRDRWAEEVCTHLVLNHTANGYFRALHFKEVHANGTISHREVFLPGPNEALAEAVLLAECSKYPAFQSPKVVFSYRLSDANDTQGFYKQYFSGLQERQQMIAEACKAGSNQVVRYTDVKRFYPSISSALARAEWAKACKAARIGADFEELGFKLLARHKTASDNANHGKGLLTGPMFSHLIANLVLREVDDTMIESFPNRYFRYVDDVVLVGSLEEVNRGRAQLAALLIQRGLDLHDEKSGKDFEVSANDWLAGEDDFSGDDSQVWMAFTRDLKQFLISQSPLREELASMFQTAGFRIPLPDYRISVNEASYQERFLINLRRYQWLFTKVKRLDPQTLLLTAERLRENYFAQLNHVLDRGPHLQGYTRKRAIPKLRYFAGRLLYLAKPDDLPRIAERLRKFPELFMLSETLHAVGTGDLTKLLPMGSNASQSAAQALKLTGAKISCRCEAWGVAERQSLAVLRANGITVPGPVDDELNQFASWCKDPRELMQSKDLFIRELASLHGVSTGARHRAILETAFDPGEELAFDATTPVETY